MVFDNFEKMQKGRAFKKGMCRFWPTPECIYQTFNVAAGDQKICSDKCSTRHCISNLCIESYFEENHFPLLRPLVYDTSPAAFEISDDLG